jgi:nucleotide-binding universal stress UspA family protein
VYQSILLAYDGTRESRLALREGADLAACCGACTHLLAIVHLPPSVLGGESMAAGGAVAGEISRFQDILDEGIARLKNRGLRCEGHLEQGDPIDVIVRMAEAVHADLVVLGYHRRRGIEKWWRSPTSAQIVERLSTSLLVAVRHEGSPPMDTASPTDLPDHPEPGCPMPS